VILQKDRHKFSGEPEKEYLNKEVCISGVVTLRNNIPYLVVQNSEQIKAKTPVDLGKVEAMIGDSITAKPTVYTSTLQQADTTAKEKTYPNPTEVVVVKRQTTPEEKNVQGQTAAEFPGGDSALALFIQKHMGVPEKLATDEQKQIIFSLEVDANGAWHNLRLVTPVVKELDVELLRALNGMPNWKPGTQNGSPVASSLTYEVRLNHTEAVSENNSAAKAPLRLLRKLPAKDTAMNVSTRPVAEEKAKTVSISNRPAVKTTKTRYKVRSKAYFHNEPDASTRRNAFIIHWNNAVLDPLEEKNGFVYIIFTNHQGQVSKGWLAKDDLIAMK
jgi:hypothetical protein